MLWFTLVCDSVDAAQPQTKKKKNWLTDLKHTTFAHHRAPHFPLKKMLPTGKRQIKSGWKHHTCVSSDITPSLQILSDTIQTGLTVQLVRICCFLLVEVLSNTAHLAETKENDSRQHLPSLFMRVSRILVKDSLIQRQR